MKKFNLHLYLVTDEASKCRYSLLETVRKAADGGVTMVQYRSTNPDAGFPGLPRYSLHRQQPH